MSYLVALGVPAPLVWVDRSLQRACPEIELRPVAGVEWCAAFPETDSIVLVASQGCSPVLCTALGCAGVTLVSRRHTPTATLRRLVQHAVQDYGGVRLLVHDGDAGLEPWRMVPARARATTLAGFLRSGRVVQADTLLSIVSS